MFDGKLVSELVRCAADRGLEDQVQRGACPTAVWDIAPRKSLRRLRPWASTQLSERQGTQTPSLAHRAPHPGSNPGWKSRKLSYSYLNESWGHVRIGRSIEIGNLRDDPGEIPAGATSGQVESTLERGAGKGANSVTFDTPNSNLAVPENGSATSGGATQYQLKEPTQIDTTKFKKTDPN